MLLIEYSFAVKHGLKFREGSVIYGTRGEFATLRQCTVMSYLAVERSVGVVAVAGVKHEPFARRVVRECPCTWTPSAPI